ncbi:MAG: universal stress protein, partial [Gammaproteobacteria bacterium]|nr:universal stress protein [Gammaproteobacteria bacterium]
MSETHYLVDILILLAAAVLSVPLFQRLGLGAVLGFLAGGVIVGPWGLGFIVDVEEIRHLAEFGVVFLLFIIGIELKPSRLWIMRRSVFGLGSAQVLVTGLLITWLTVSFGVPIRAAIIVGFGLALSSTAFGLQILAEKGDVGTAYGRSSFAILLLQDLAVVPLIALVPLLAQEGMSITEDLELVVLETVLIMVGVLAFGHFLLRPLLDFVAGGRNPEIFTSTAVLLVLGTAWLTDQAGMSMALGAFLAGLLLSNSRYRHQIMADIHPFRGILLGLFFMTVGMSIDFGLLNRQGGQVAGLVVGLLLLKAALLWALCRGTGRSHREALQVSLLLSQGGEFGFVLFGLANTANVIDGEFYRLLLLVVAMSMAATPLLVKLTPLLGRLPKGNQPAGKTAVEPVPESHNHVLIAGFGQIGQRVAMVLAKEGVPYLALDINPARVAESRFRGYSVFYGDACDIHVLQAAGVANATLVVFTLDQMKAVEQGVALVREAHPDLPVYARAWDLRTGRRLRNIGVTYAVPETLEVGLQLGVAVLRVIGISMDKACRLVDEFREQDYKQLARHISYREPQKLQDTLFVSTRGAEERTALERAVVLAEHNQASLTVVDVLEGSASDSEETSHGSMLDDVQMGMVAERRQRLEELVAPLLERIEVQVKVLIGTPVLEIIREVLDNEPDLVVKEREGNDDMPLLRMCPCPLLLVNATDPKPYRRILAAVEVEEYGTGHREARDALNRKVLEVAASLALSETTELHVVHAWKAYGEEVLRSGHSPYRVDAGLYVANARKRHQDALDRLLAEVRESVGSEMLDTLKTNTHLVKGDPRDEITRLAREQEADLVVLGTVGDTGIPGFIMGNVAEEIIHRLECSVLAVKPPGFVPQGDV